MRTMDKVITLFLKFVLVLMCVCAGAALYYTTTSYETENEQLESKINQLQQENASLHDDVWILNQELMKGCME